MSLDSQKHFPQYQGGDSGLPAEGETPFDMDSVASSSMSSPHSTPLITPIGSPGQYRRESSRFILAEGVGPLFLSIFACTFINLISFVILAMLTLWKLYINTPQIR